MSPDESVLIFMERHSGKCSYLFKFLLFKLFFYLISICINEFWGRKEGGKWGSEEGRKEGWISNDNGKNRQSRWPELWLTSQNRTEPSRSPVAWPPHVWWRDWSCWDGGRSGTRQPSARQTADMPQSLPEQRQAGRKPLMSMFLYWATGITALTVPRHTYLTHTRRHKVKVSRFILRPSLP